VKIYAKEFQPDLTALNVVDMPFRASTRYSHSTAQ